MNNNSNQVVKYVDSIGDTLVEISDTIWQYAELGFKEFKSSKLLAITLKEAGFSTNLSVASLPTAFVSRYGMGHPIIGILGEYDALPGMNQAPVPYEQAINEGAPGHGCGHNLLATASLGAALAVKRVLDSYSVKGTIIYFGCLAEEIFASKGYMIDPGGLFDDVDIVITWHPQAFNTIRLSSNSAINSSLFKFRGKTAHAAADPYNGRSALDAIELMNVGANYMREHMIPEAKFHYVITNGGKAPNIVPEEAEVYYSIRAPKRHVVEEIYTRLIKIAKGAELMTETQLEIEFLDGTHNQIRNQVVNDVLFKKMNEIGPPRFSDHEKEFAKEIKKFTPTNSLDAIMNSVPPKLHDIATKVFSSPLCPIIIPPLGKGEVNTGCTDVGDVSWNVPLGEFWMCCFAMGSTNHSWQATATSGMSIGHKGMLNAAKIIASSALEFMGNPTLV